MCLALLHGEFLVYGVVMASLLTCAVAFVLWSRLRHTNTSGLKVAAVYFMLAGMSCLMLMRDSDSWLWFITTVALVLPHSLIAMLTASDSMSDHAFAGIMLVCAGLNALFILLKFRKEA